MGRKQAAGSCSKGPSARGKGLLRHCCGNESGDLDILSDRRSGAQASAQRETHFSCPSAHSFVAPAERRGLSSAKKVQENWALWLQS